MLHLTTAIHQYECLTKKQLHQFYSHNLTWKRHKEHKKTCHKVIRLFNGCASSIGFIPFFIVAKASWKGFHHREWPLRRLFYLSLWIHEWCPSQLNSVHKWSCEIPFYLIRLLGTFYRECFLHKKKTKCFYISQFSTEKSERERERGTGWVSEKRAHVCCAIRHYLKYNMYTFFQHFSHVSIRSWLTSKWIHASIHTHLLCHLVALEQLTTENEPNK